MLHAFGRLFTERPETSTSVVMCCSCDEEATTIGVQDLVSYWQCIGWAVRNFSHRVPMVR